MGLKRQSVAEGLVAPRFQIPLASYTRGCLAWELRGRWVPSRFAVYKKQGRQLYFKGRRIRLSAPDDLLLRAEYAYQ